jgi:hypothetical protein
VLARHLGTEQPLKPSPATDQGQRPEILAPSGAPWTAGARQVQVRIGRASPHGGRQHERCTRCRRPLPKASRTSREAVGLVTVSGTD